MAVSYIDDRPVAQRMKVRPYDRVAAILIAMLIFVGYFDALMLAMWLSPWLEPGKKPAVIKIVLDTPGRGDHAEGLERDKDPPGAEALSEATEPAVEHLLEAVTEVVTATAAALDHVSTVNSATSDGAGSGDLRRAGPLHDGDDLVPPWERWVLKYNTSSLDEYARQLDALKIELGAVGGGYQLVDYGSNFSTVPLKRQGESGQEQRIYFNWTSGTLRALDRRLLQRAGVSTQGRLICQFIPKALEAELLVLELTKAARSMGIVLPISQLSESEQINILKRVTKTTFVCEASQGSYEFRIVNQEIR